MGTREMIDFFVQSPPHSLGWIAYAFACLMALGANALCERFLVELGLSWGAISRQARWLRVVRWVGVVLGCVVAVWLAEPAVWLGRVVGVAMFSVSAGCDLESHHVPPDWFTLGGTVAMVGVWGVVAGWEGAAGALLAQALCYGVMTFGIAAFKFAAGGDVKLMMQYGAVVGSVSGVGLAFVVEWVVRVVWLAGWVLREVAEGRVDDVLRGARELRAPHGPFAWLGVMGWIAIF